MLIVGSHALLHHGVRLGRKPSDIDIIATRDEVEKWLKDLDPERQRRYEEKKNKLVVHLKGERPIEFEIADEEKNPTAMELMEREGYSRKGKHPLFPNMVVNFAHPEEVLALKLSHRYLKNNPHFRKTMDDILALRGLKYRVSPELNDWLKRREKATYDYGHPSLKRDKAKFFSGDGINYVWEHDDIHEALATITPEWRSGPRPAYVQFQKDADLDVSVSKEKWNLCDEEVKLNSVLEESYVLALERSQVPNHFAIPPRTSFLIALEKVCTSITSGWWREYAWENYYKVLAMYNDDYVDRFQKAVFEKRIRPYQGEK